MYQEKTKSHSTLNVLFLSFSNQKISKAFLFYSNIPSKSFFQTMKQIPQANLETSQ